MVRFRIPYPITKLYDLINSKMPTPRKDPEKKFKPQSISLPPWMWASIERHRREQGLDSTSEAIRSLLKKAGVKEES